MSKVTLVVPECRVDPFEDYIKHAMMNNHIPRLVTGYRWHDPTATPPTLDLIKTKQFSYMEPDGNVIDMLFYCDDTVSWASPHLKGMSLYKLAFMIKEPCLYLNSEKAFESIKSTTFDSMRNIGFDAVAHCPSLAYKDIHVRQAVLLNPSKQIVSVELIKTT